MKPKSLSLLRSTCLRKWPPPLRDDSPTYSFYSYLFYLFPFFFLFFVFSPGCLKVQKHRYNNHYKINNMIQEIRRHEIHSEEESGKGVRESLTRL